MHFELFLIYNEILINFFLRKNYTKMRLFIFHYYADINNNCLDYNNKQANS